MDSIVLFVVWLSTSQFSYRTSLMVQAQAVCLPASACSMASHRCLPDSSKECLGTTRMPPASDANFPEVEQCNTNRGVYQPCTSMSGESFSELPYANVSLINVRTEFLANNPAFFTVNASWEIEASPYVTGHYQVKILGHKQGRTRSRGRACVCVKGTRILNYSFTGLHYDAHDDDTLSVEVIPYPRPPDERDDGRMESEQLKRPTGCADTIVGNTICNTKIYGQSENLTVVSCPASDGTKTLRIEWLPPSIPSGAPLPQIYYLQLHRIGEVSLYAFKVINATSVEVRNLNVSYSYEARLQSYKRCSGVGNFFIRDGRDDFLGCGRTAQRKETPSVVCGETTDSNSSPVGNEIIAGDGSSATTDMKTSPVGAYINAASSAATDVNTSPVGISGADINSMAAIDMKSTTSGDDITARGSSPLLYLLFLLALLPAAILTIIIAYVASCKPESVSYPEPGIFKVFVYYCSSTTEKDVEYIQKYVVSALSQYFEVISPNNFSRGNMSASLEEAVRTSDKVLLVCNQELCKEWGKEHDRNPGLNSMCHLISAAVSSNDISRFGIVLTEKKQKETYIPEDYYVRLMRVFVVDKDSDLSSLCRFVTHSRTFQFSSTNNTPNSMALEHVSGWTSNTGTTPTSEGPEHIGIHSAFECATNTPTSEGPEHVAVLSTYVCSSPDVTPTSEGPEHVAVSVE